MKILIIGNEDRYRKYMPDLEIIRQITMVFCPRGASDEELLEAAWDADAISIDPVARLSGNVIRQMPKLKIIQSEGVGFNGIDCQTAKEKGIYVCNCKGANAGAVAEQAILLMLALLRSIITGDRLEREGRQMEMKERLMYEGIAELGDCKIGLIGLGDIAKAAAKRLLPFECEIFYYDKSRAPQELEEEYHVSYMELDKMISTCDIISLHCPVTPETVGMVNAEFLSKMKTTAYLINTARGDIVDNQALYDAVVMGEIRGVGLDTVYPEPTTRDNVLLNLPEECKERIIFSPHIGGITTSFFRRAHVLNWGNVETALNGKRPQHIVNGL
ncbi:2-hydroxyacid dehydrogenase [Sporomusa sp. KB1]|jgi:lactate dehydrogenase-like 2-hydroxyacid dehydrogenase|uniref:2-hydroxyacid dehydrogenase n=1 Tax=Sporomusa sp. KB1 TaxID=943346 RepID=UPI00119D7831|nr:2-hydroxyacid dehydrogenase [Sporomusa sp. KB1]TWH47745.1 lactate dehydrogenase-like 2-hydroxyacid dehydrogenase [Sporomusa sp. KB1]